jgi:hypothetical protein
LQKYIPIGTYFSAAQPIDNDDVDQLLLQSITIWNSNGSESTVALAAALIDDDSLKTTIPAPIARPTPKTSTVVRGDTPLVAKNGCGVEIWKQTAVTQQNADDVVSGWECVIRY